MGDAQLTDFLHSESPEVAHVGLRLERLAEREVVVRRPPPGGLPAEVELLELGDRLPVGPAPLRAVGGADLLADAAPTHAIPPRS